MKKVKNLLVIFLILLILLSLTFVIYLNIGIYRATKEVEQYLASTQTVKISEFDGGYFFDGEGDDTAIVFYPGAKVEYIAYSKLMYKIAESGKDCFLVKMPFNIAIFGSNKAKNIIEKYNYKNWYIAGHSLGGAMACNYVSNNPERIKGVITFAAYPTKELPSNTQYISIYGSEDLILNKDSYNKGKTYWSENSIEYIIDGGNHSGFANYGEQKGDGKATITSEMQIDYVVKKLGEILNE